MVNLYQEEIEKIHDVVYKVSKTYWGKSVSGENLSLLHRELLGRLEDLGFKAEVDVTPVFHGLPVAVSILERLDGEQEWDKERRSFEIKELKKKNELDKSKQIDGNV